MIPRSKREVITSVLRAQEGIAEVPEDEILDYIEPLLSSGESCDVESAATLLSETSEVEMEIARTATKAAALAISGFFPCEEKEEVNDSVEALDAPVVMLKEEAGGRRLKKKSKSPPPHKKKSKSPPPSRNKSKSPPPPTSSDDVQDALDDTDDFASAWRRCREEGRSWGGRGFGGRGVARRYQAMSLSSRDVLVDGVTLAFAGKELLKRAELRLVAGRRYGLLGKNGVGKTTLLRRIATGSLPGFPPHLRIGYLAQEHRGLGEETRSPVEALVEGACRRRRKTLEEEKDALEEALGDGGDDQQDISEIGDRLCELEAELSELSEDVARRSALKTLKRVGFTEELAATPAQLLSGGWRMRVELAAVLLEKCDLLLLDEPTNHLDINGVLWLEQFLTDENKGESPTVLCVSHDRAFVEAIATDIVVFESQQLTYFNGGLEAFEQRTEERAIADRHRVDARVRQETAAREASEKMRQKATSQKKGTNDNALRQAKQRLSKIERVGLYRDDGKRFKTHSLAKMDEAALRLPQQVSLNTKSAKEEKFEFPECTLDAWYVSLDGVDVGYDDALVKGVVAALDPGSRVAIVGDNGTGKTTLLKTIAGLVEPLNGTGERVRRHPKLKVAYVKQDHAEALQASIGDHAKTSAAEYLSNRFHVSELEARAKLGKFGIGSAAKLAVSSLSGGQKARLSLAALTWESPHVILLDEPTNHLDMSALDALAHALSNYAGAVVVVSHNRAFLAACCNELWELDQNKRLTVHRHADFNELFAAYADRVLRRGQHSNTGGLSTSSAAKFTDSRLARRADALHGNSASRKNTPGSKKAPSAAGAAARTALL